MLMEIKQKQIDANQDVQKTPLPLPMNMKH